MDYVVSFLDNTNETSEYDFPRICVVGRPNVGKSSLVNLLLDDEKNIVTNQAGTTRDSIDSYFKKYNQEFILVDTAGIRKKSKVKEDLEYYSVIRSIGAIENSDVCILMIDAQTGMENQDQKIFSLITKNQRGVVLLINKYDLVKKKKDEKIIIENKIKEKIAPFTDIPIIFISVLNKQRVLKSIESAVDVHKRLSFKISTSKLNDYLLSIIEKIHPQVQKEKELRLNT